MSAEGLLTVFGLVLAVVAILPPERRMDFELRLGWIDVLLVVSAILVVHYIAFFSVFHAIGLTFPLGPWRWGFDPASASYLIMGAVAVAVLVHSRFALLSPRKAGKFRALLERLLHDGKTLDLVYLLERHLSGLHAIRENKFLSTRLCNWLLHDPPPQIAVRHIGGATSSTRESANEAKRVIQTILEGGAAAASLIRTRIAFVKAKVSWPMRQLRSLATYLPNHDRDSDEAGHALRRILYSEDFASQLAKTRPYFALRLLPVAHFDREEFQDLFIRELLRDSGSVLYFEIRNSQNLWGYRYKIPAGNQLLRFYLEDASRADDYGVYKPFGEFALRELDHRNSNDGDDAYLKSSDGFEEQKWNSPLYIVIRFFDLMVREALFQNVQSHMWLFYMPHIVESIVRNIRHVDVTFERHREWPTTYHYLLYQIVDANCDWIEAVLDVPTEQENAKLAQVDARHDNANIPKSAAIALGRLFRTIVEAPHISDSYKRYLLMMVFRCYFKLRRSKTRADYSKVLLTALATGGTGSATTSTPYVAELRRLFEKLDLIAFHGDPVDEVREELVRFAAQGSA